MTNKTSSPNKDYLSIHLSSLKEDNESAWHRIAGVYDYAFCPQSQLDVQCFYRAIPINADCLI